MDKDYEKHIAFCPLCDWKSVSSGNKYKGFRRKNKTANEVLYDRLFNHLEIEHIEMIIEVWMNNQSDRNIIEFDKKDIKCLGCRNILALCDCVEPKVKGVD